MRRTKLLTAVLPALLFMTMVAGCSRMQKSHMAASPQVPAAQGTVTSERMKDGNTRFLVRVKHLATPSELRSNARNYVVWVQPEDRSRPPQNMGVISVDPKDLDGNFIGMTPYNDFRVIITAEQQPTAPTPSDNVVLSTRVYQPAG